MKAEPPYPADSGRESPDAGLAEVIQQIVRAIQSVRYGSVEVVIQNSKVVQIERNEKFRFDKPAKL